MNDKTELQINFEHKVCLFPDFQINADLFSEKEYSIVEYCSILHILMHVNWSTMHHKVNAYFYPKL